MPKRGLDKKNRPCETNSMSQRRTKYTFSTDQLIAVAQAAKELGVHLATVYRWIEKGTLHPVRIGSQVFLEVQEVKALKEQRAGE